ncbi:MAG: RnfABCDGE type electron transport complex subunit D [Verrucomicrobia bacterium]|nr:RnfABCDGE type electron transport complex subunit D [Verrucomicrobiota bacterium]
MSVIRKPISGPPYLTVTDSSAVQTFWCVAMLLILGGLYSLFYQPLFILKLSGYMVLATLIELLYRFLRDGNLRIKNAGAALTAGLLVMSVPADMPVRTICLALLVSVGLIKMSGSNSLRFNAAVAGRFFLMLVFGAEIVRWNYSGQQLDGLTGATPIELWHSDEHITGLMNLFTGRIHENWEGLYQIIPGAPGELFRPVLILFGIILFVRGIIDWRGGVAFLTAFALTCAAVGEPVGFHLLSGAVLFVAVFIVTDPKSSPASRTGRLIAGALAGTINGCIRHYTFYSEGIVYSILTMNLLTPTIDRAAFRMRGWLIHRRRHRFAQHLAGQHKNQHEHT